MSRESVARISQSLEPRSLTVQVSNGAHAKGEKADFEDDDEVSPLDYARHALLWNLAQALLDLSAEIAGDIDQDLPPP